MKGLRPLYNYKPTTVRNAVRPPTLLSLFLYLRPHNMASGVEARKWLRHASEQARSVLSAAWETSQESHGAHENLFAAIQFHQDCAAASLLLFERGESLGCYSLRNYVPPFVDNRQHTHLTLTILFCAPVRVLLQISSWRRQPCSWPWLNVAGLSTSAPRDPRSRWLRPAPPT